MIAVDESGKVTKPEDFEAPPKRYLTPRERAARDTAMIQQIREDREINSRPVFAGLTAVVVEHARLSKPLTADEWKEVEVLKEQRVKVREIALENAPTKIKGDWIAQHKDIRQRVADGDKSVTRDFSMSKEDFQSSKMEVLRAAKAEIRRIDGALESYWHRCVAAAQKSAAELMANRAKEEQAGCERYGWPYSPSPIVLALEKLARKPEQVLNYSVPALIAFK